MKLYDQNGNECQMTGLPHMFYDKVAVNERIAELEAALRGLMNALEDSGPIEVSKQVNDAFIEAHRVL